MQSVKQVTVTIASGAALSGAVDLNFEQLAGLVTPAAWTAADISFQGSQDGVNFADVFTAAGEYTIPSAQVAPNRQFLLATHDTASLRWIKVRSGVAATPVNQAADRVITLLTRELA